MILIVMGGVCLVYALGLFWRSRAVLAKNKLHLHPRTEEPRIAVLVPARDESAVIEGLIKALKAQTISLHPEDIYVIVERRDDPTVEIGRAEGISVILRRDLTKKCKGAALDEAVKRILAQEKHYDLYFIFDADNLMEPDYIQKMLKSYYAGYEIVTGYRNSKNANDNVIAAVSSLTFSMINVMSNRTRIRYGANVVFSGTGCFIDGKLVEEWKGWPFQSLTEDYEMSLYATLHGLATYYNEEAVFYDEQPTKYRQTVAQRVRWIKGYFTARKVYVPLMKAKRRSDNYGSLVREEIGVKPAIWAVVGVVLIVLGAAIRLFYVQKAAFDVTMLVGVVLVVYLVLMIATIVMLKREKLELKPSMTVKTVLFNPIYLVTYVPCALKALLKRKVTWQRIKHGK